MDGREGRWIDELGIIGSKGRWMEYKVSLRMG